MVLKLLLAAFATLSFSASSYAATIKWEHRTNTNRKWDMSGTITNGELTMDGAVCTTTSSSAKKVKATCTYQTGYCRKGDRVRLTVNLGGSKPKVRSSGNCNGGRF